MPHDIIFINRFFYPDHSATSQLLTDLAFHLAENEYKVSVICSHQVYDKSRKVLPSREIVNGVNIYRVKTTNFGRNWLPGRMIDYLSYFIGMSWLLMRLAKQESVIVAKTDPPLTSIVTLIIAKFKKAKHVNWVQDLFPEIVVAMRIKQIPSLLANWLVKIRNWSFHQSDQTVVIGEIMKSKLVAQGISSNLITIIPNWSDVKNIIPVSRVENPLMETWNLKEKFIVAYSGNMGRVHEFNTIISAAYELRNKSNIIFIFIGDGPKKKCIKSNADKLELTNVRFFPYQPYENLSSSLSLPDVHIVSLKPEFEGYCVPSKYYGIIAAGKPTLYVGDKDGEIARLIKADQCGTQIEIEDSTALVYEITKLYENPKKLDEMCQNARHSFIVKYDKKIAMKHWFSLFQSLIMHDTN